MHAVFRPRHFIGERRGACGQRIGVGHFENRGHSAERSRAGAGLQIFLMRRARLTEMHLRVDHARQNMEAGGVDCLSSAGVEEVADFSDFPGSDSDVRARSTPVWSATMPPFKIKSKFCGTGSSIAKQKQLASRLWRIIYKEAE